MYHSSTDCFPQSKAAIVEHRYSYGTEVIIQVNNDSRNTKVTIPAHNDSCNATSDGYST